MRGLVISPPIEHSAGKLYIKSSSLDPQELRFSLLFWDKLNAPDNNLISMGLGADADFLMKAGILDRARIVLRGSGSLEDGFRQAHIAAFNQLDTGEPGVWSLATGERSISFLDSELTTGRGALVSLHRAIPVPDKDVHLQDVLDFRQKRKSELLALRHHLETLYVEVSNAHDQDLALNSKVEALDRALSDYIKSTRGLGLKWRLSGFEASINLKVRPAGAAAAGAVAYSVGLSVAEVALAAVVGSAIQSTFNLKASSGLSRPKTTPTPFRYVSAYYDELFPSVDEARATPP